MAFPPTPTLAISSCPVPKAYSGVHDPDTDGSLTSPQIATGDTAAGTSKANRMGARADVTARIGAGIWGVVPGSSGADLNLSAGSGLTLNIAEGLAMMDGAVYYPGGSVILTDNIARIWIWLSQAGAIVPVNNSTTPPAGAHVLLGSAVTAGGAITSVDFSGVVYLQGQNAFRFNTGSGTPTGTPPANISFFQILTGDNSLWLWTGATWRAVGSASALLAASHTSVPVSGSLTLSDSQARSGSLTLTDDGVASSFVVTFPTASITAGQRWAVRNLTQEGARLVAQGGSKAVYLQSGLEGMVTHVWFDGTELRDLAHGAHFLEGIDFTIGGSTSYSQFEEVKCDYLNFELSSDATALLPTAGAGGNVGHHFIVENGDAVDLLDVHTNGASGDEANNHLLPGEVQLFAVNSAGSVIRVPTRAYTRAATATFPSDADFTPAHPAFLASTLRVTSSVSLTAARNLILPLQADKEWFVVNATTGGQSITVKGSSGTGVTIASGAAARVRCDGTNFSRLTPDALPSALPAGPLFAATATATVANTTTEGTLIGAGVGSLTLPANFLVPGRSLRLLARGLISTAAVPGTLTLAGKLGATTLASTGAQTPEASLTDNVWEVDLVITCRTIGGSGTVFVQGFYRTTAGGGAGNAVQWEMGVTAAVTVDTTTAQALDLTADWQTADAANSIRGTNALVTVLG